MHSYTNKRYVHMLVCVCYVCVDASPTSVDSNPVPNGLSPPKAAAVVTRRMSWRAMVGIEDPAASSPSSSLVSDASKQAGMYCTSHCSISHINYHFANWLIVCFW